MNLDSVKALLFDLDGTLIHSSEDIADCANWLRQSKGLEPLPLARVSGYIGDGVEALVSRVMGPDFQANLPVLVDAFKARYHEHCCDKTCLYPGVAETLAELQRRGYKMAVVTNKPERISLRILELLGVGGHFAAVIGGNSAHAKKPDPAPLKLACQRLGLPLEQAAMIGDSRVDIESGHNAGIPSVAILGGIGDQAMLRQAKPAFEVANFSGLTELLKGIA